MTETTSILSFPPFHIPAKVDLLYRGQTMIPLERRAVQVLRFLAEHHDRVVTKDELLEAVWPDTFTTDGVLKRAVSQARRALGDGTDEIRFIETYHGQGYRFIAAVTTAAAVPTLTTEPARTPPPPATEIPPPPQTEALAVGIPNYNQLIGRAAESAVLQSEYRRVQDGAGHPVMLIGEPGIGKTQLARRFKLWAQEQGARCLSARFFDYQASRLAPFEILLDMLRAALCHDPGDCDLRVLAMTKLNIALPEELFIETQALAAAASNASGAPAGQFGTRRNTGAFSSTTARAIIPISQCFMRLSQRSPLVLIFDDLQWADDASLGVIGYLMRTMQSEPLMIVGLARTDAAADREHLLRIWLKEQASYRSFTGLVLRPLDEAACQQAIAAVFQNKIQLPPADLNTLHRVTEGNPYFLIEMVRLLVAENAITYADGSWHWHGLTAFHLPETLVMAAQAKLERLSDEVREMVDCAAVLGEEFRLDTLAKLTGKNEADMEALLLEGVQRGVLSERGLSAGNDARFYHTILRRVLYDQLPSRRRKRLHLLAAQAIEETHQHEPERLADAISVHYATAGAAQKTFVWSMRAWQAASSRWHWSEAMSSIERATWAAHELSHRGEQQLPPVDKLKLLFGVGETCYATGQLKESETAYSEAIALANTVNDRGALAVALLQQGQTRMGLSTYREAEIATEQALEVYQQMNDPEGAALALVQLGGIKVRLGKYEDAATLAERSLEGVALNSQIAAIAFGLLGWARALQGHYAEGVPLLERAVDYMGNIGDVQRRALLLRRRHWADLSRGRYETAIQLAQRARDDFHSIGDTRGVAQMDMGLGQARLGQGLYEEALAFLQRAGETAHGIGDTHLEAETIWLRGRALGELGQAQHAEQLLQQALALVREVGDRDDEFRVLTDLARLKNEAQEYATASQLAHLAVTIAQELNNYDGLGIAQIEHARAVAGLGQRAAALSALQQAVEWLDKTESGERWRAHSALAQIIDETENLPGKLAALRKTVALLDAIRTQPEATDEVRRKAIAAARCAPARGLAKLLPQSNEATALAQAWSLP